MKQYILTGGPGTGKSSIILALERRGEYVVREAAEDTIRYMQASGIEEPWLRYDFQKEVVLLQQQREARIPESIERIFFDRGLYDSLAYIQKYGHPMFPEFLEATKDCMYDKVFLVENLGKCENTDYRAESLEEALDLEKRQRENYEKLGFEIITVPVMTLEDRVNFVLSKCD